MANHLRDEALLAAVLDEPLTDEQKQHLGSCGFCSTIVQREREENPILKGAREAEDKDAYWAEVRRIQAEITQLPLPGPPFYGIFARDPSQCGKVLVLGCHA